MENEKKLEDIERQYERNLYERYLSEAVTEKNAIKSENEKLWKVFADAIKSQWVMAETIQKISERIIR